VISTVLQGKHKPFYHPAIEECGDSVIVLNSDKVVFSGRKEEQKMYRHHTGFKVCVYGVFYLLVLK
jgi:large subunit ribosomal protein L13